MRFNLKKTLAGVATVAIVATVAPFVGSSAVSAATNNGSVTLTPAAGNSGTNITFGFPSTPACPFDGLAAPAPPATPRPGNWRWHGFLIDAANDIDTELQFDGGGPVASLLTGYSTPLLTPTGTVLVNQFPNVGSAIISFPQVGFGLFAPGEVPPGTYKVGVACTSGDLGPAVQTYWSRLITVTADAAGGPAQFNYSTGAQALSPTLDSVIPGDGQLTANYTGGGSDPADTSYIVIADAVNPAVPDVIDIDTASPTTLTGLVNGEEYSVTVIAENGVPAPGVGSVPSNAILATPSVVRTAPVVTASPGGVGGASVTWTPAGGAPTSYLVSISPAPTVGSATQTIPASGPLAASFTNLGGGLHTVTVQAQGYPVGESAPPGNDDVNVIPPVAPDGTPATLIQTIQVDRAQVNAIVFEQDCGAGWVTTPCAVNMAEGPLDATGQYYPATGVLNTIRVIDARDTDKGWTVTANVADAFTDGAKSFDARALGWTPRELFQSPALGNGYTMTVGPGPSIAPWSATSALKDGTAVLMQSVPAGGVQQGLGRAEYVADLSILVPISAPSGAYSADIVFTLVNKT